MRPEGERGGFAVTFSAVSAPRQACPANFKRSTHRGWAVTSADMRELSAPRRVLQHVGPDAILLLNRHQLGLVLTQVRRDTDGARSRRHRHRRRVLEHVGLDVISRRP